MTKIQKILESVNKIFNIYQFIPWKIAKDHTKKWSVLGTTRINSYVFKPVELEPGIRRNILKKLLICIFFVTE